MDGEGRIARTLNRLWSGIAEACAQFRADLAAKRRAPRGRDVPRGVGSAAALLFLAACLTAGFVQGGHYDVMRRMHGPLHDIIARAFGFGVSEIAVSGNVELTRDEVIALSGLNPQTSLPFLDPAALQARLAQVPMVAEATISKLYPDRLKIDIKERVPFALWQHDGQVKVIAADGTAIETLSDPRFLRLPHVVGKGANFRVKEYVALLEAAPALAGKIRAGTLVSGRRWTVKLQNGVDIKLPETETQAALVAFAALDQQTGLSGRAVLSIDLRVPERIYVRLTEEAAATYADGIAQRIKKTGGRVL